MGLLQKELQDATGLPEQRIKQVLHDALSEEDLRTSRASYNAKDDDLSWAFLTYCYASPPATMTDRMLAVLKKKGGKR